MEACPFWCRTRRTPPLSLDLNLKVLQDLLDLIPDDRRNLINGLSALDDKGKCHLYTRVSTSMQVDGYSLDAQRDKLRKYAASENMIVAVEYSDEGFSGKNIQGRQR